MYLCKLKQSECLYIQKGFSLSSVWSSHISVFKLHKHVSNLACNTNVNTATFKRSRSIVRALVRRWLSTRSRSLTPVWPDAEPQWNENNFSQHSPQKKFCWHGVTELKRLLDAIATLRLSPLLEVVVTLEVLNWEHKSYQGIWRGKHTATNKLNQSAQSPAVCSRGERSGTDINAYTSVVRAYLLTCWVSVTGVDPLRLTIYAPVAPSYRPGEISCTALVVLWLFVRGMRHSHYPKTCKL